MHSHQRDWSRFTGGPAYQKLITSSQSSRPLLLFSRFGYDAEHDGETLRRERQLDGRTGRRTDGRTDGRAGGQTGGQRDRETEKQRDRETERGILAGMIFNVNLHTLDISLVRLDKIIVEASDLMDSSMQESTNVCAEWNVYDHLWVKLPGGLIKINGRERAFLPHDVTSDLYSGYSVRIVDDRAVRRRLVYKAHLGKNIRGKQHTKQIVREKYSWKKWELKFLTTKF